MEYKKLANLSIRGIVVINLLVISAGPLLAIVLVDAVTFVVGSLWLLGDIIPCVALTILIHDLIAHDVFVNRKFYERDLIVIAIAVVYCLDLYICSANFRHLSRNFQIVIAIVYLVRTSDADKWLQCAKDMLSSLKTSLRHPLVKATDQPSTVRAAVAVAKMQPQSEGHKSASQQKRTTKTTSTTTTQRKTATKKKTQTRRNTGSKGTRTQARRTTVRTSTRRSRGCSHRPTTSRSRSKTPKLKILHSVDVY